jgi:hypothetical protein
VLKQSFFNKRVARLYQEKVQGEKLSAVKSVLGVYLDVHIERPPKNKSLQQIVCQTKKQNKNKRHHCTLLQR